MNAITKSRNAMALVTAAVGFYALGVVFAIIAYATFSGDSQDSFNTFTDLNHAAAWLHFVGILVAFLAVCLVVWETMAARIADQLAELATAAIATLLIAIGALVGAASDSSKSTSNIVEAIGVGVWALLVLSRAARLNLAAQKTPDSGPPLAQLWLTAAGGLLLLAVALGFNVGPQDQGLGIAVGILDVVAFGLLAWTLVSARTFGLIGGLPTRLVVEALGALAVASVIGAVVSGLVFTPNGTLKGLRIGVSITYTARLVGFAMLAWAAWRRLGELVSGRPAVVRSARWGWSWTGPTGDGSPPPQPPPHEPASE